MSTARVPVPILNPVPNPVLAPLLRAARALAIAVVVVLVAVAAPATVGADPVAAAPPGAAAHGPSASRSSTPDPSAPDAYARVRGMTVSCHGSGQVWGTDAMVETMRELRDLGVNWVTIHPYAGIAGDGTVGAGRVDRLYADPVWLTRPIHEAHALGLKIMIKPHLAYWGSPFSWRGDIAFGDDEAAWARFFATYERWITRVAELSAGADAFAVGTELDRTVHREDDWRRIIAAVRARIAAPLTYSANWDRYGTVPFWDALDAIGIQGYFPLADGPGLPSVAELDRAWARLVADLEAYGRRHDRRIVLGELGYNDSALAAQRPWDERRGGEHAEEIQRRCLDAALRAIDGSDRVSGAFLWKWFPGAPRRHHSDFLMSTPSMREVIARNWRRAG